MNAIYLIAIVLSLLGPVCTETPQKTKPVVTETQPVITETRPAIATETPQRTEPAETPERGITPEISATPAPNKPESKPNKPHEIRLPSGGFGPQEAPVNQTPWALAIVCVCVLGLASILLALFVGAWLREGTRGLNPKEWDE